MFIHHRQRDNLALLIFSMAQASTFGTFSARLSVSSLAQYPPMAFRMTVGEVGHSVLLLSRFATAFWYTVDADTFRLSWQTLDLHLASIRIVLEVAFRKGVWKLACLGFWHYLPIADGVL